MQLIKKPAAYCLLTKILNFFLVLNLSLVTKLAYFKACLFRRLLKIFEKQENLNRDIRKKARKSEMTKNHEKMKEKREFKKLRKNQRK